MDEIVAEANGLSANDARSVRILECRSHRVAKEILERSSDHLLKHQASPIVAALSPLGIGVRILDRGAYSSVSLLLQECPTQTAEMSDIDTTRMQSSL